MLYIGKSVLGLKMNTVFSRERVNTGRQLEFDPVKAVTIVLMVWTHTYETLSTGFEPSLSAINSYVRGAIGGAVLDQGSSGNYWSSTPDGSRYAYYLYFGSGYQYVDINGRSLGCSVRAVLAEED